MKTPTHAQSARLDEGSIARLKAINVQLDALQMQIHTLAKAYRTQISQAASDLGLPVDDIHIEAELDFCLGPSDPQYDPTFEHSDNRVASRTLHSPESPVLLHFGIDEPSSVIGPQGWLFHDLTEHGYGEDQPEVTPVELLRVYEVNINIFFNHSIRVRIN
nr:hypothetical protein [uncultured Albidiferax sp.]